MNTELTYERKIALRIAVAVGILLAAFLAVKTIGEVKKIGILGTETPPQSTITVSGKGEKLAIPDIAELSFSVVAEADTASGAQEKATEKMNAVLKGVRGLGVEEKDIKTTGYFMNPRYEYVKMGAPCTPWGCPPDGERRLAGYEVSQSVMVKIRKLDQAGAAVSTVVAAGATNVSGISFAIEDEEGARAEARGRAIKDAQAKAKLLAEQLSVRIVRVVNFNESGAYPVYLKSMTAERGGYGGDAAAPVPEVPPGETEIVSNVTITYEIR